MAFIDVVEWSPQDNAEFDIAFRTAISVHILSL